MKTPKTIYFEEDVLESLMGIQSHFRSKFINQLIRDYFKNNDSIKLVIDVPLHAKKTKDTVKSNSAMAPDKESDAINKNQKSDYEIMF